jgi:hypothetical protein
VPMAPPVPETMSEAAAASSDGRTISYPAATAAAEVTPTHKVSPATRSIPAEKAKNEKK